MAWIDLCLAIRTEGCRGGSLKWRGIDDLLVAMRYKPDEKETVAELLRLCQGCGVVAIEGAELKVAPDIWEEIWVKDKPALTGAQRQARYRRKTKGVTDIEPKVTASDAM
jgi:hypothetical protein